MKKSRKCIGIDLGTTNSCVSVIEGGTATVIPNSEGNRTTPSIVLIDKSERKVGEVAKRKAVMQPKNIISSVKRFMGMNYDECKNDIDNVSYSVINENSQPKIRIDDINYSPQEISAMILQRMKKTAEDYLGEEVTDAVITVPAYFSDAQRQATKEAGEIAGLKVQRIVNEPTAAALAFGLDKLNKDMKIAVFDLGGGTFDISILEMGDGVFEVKSTNGDTHLGGNDFDNVLSDWIVSEFNKQEGIDISGDPVAMQRVREAAEKAKIELSNSTNTEVNLPYLFPVDGIPKHFNGKLTRAEFERMVSKLVDKCILPCKKAIKDSMIKISDIDEVLLVGGSTRMPIIQQRVKEFFGKDPSKSVNPDEAVAIGAAIQGGVLNGEMTDILLIDVTPLSLGIESLGGVMTKLIDANSTIPIKKTEVFTTASDNQTDVEIRVLQGERAMAKDNRVLGIFHLDGIAPALRGIPKIEVSFDIDSNGILSVSAKDQGTGKEQSIKIESKSGLSQDEIDRMKKEAIEFSENDKAEKNKADKINKLDSLLFQIDKSLNDDNIKDKITDDEKLYFNTLKDDIKNDFNKKIIDNVDDYEKRFNTKWIEISSKMYNNTSKSENNNPINDIFTKQDNSNNSMEAEYEDIK